MIKCILKYGVGGVWVQLLGSEGFRARVILVLHERIWNAPAGVSLVLPAFNTTGSLGSLRVMWSISLVPRVTTSRFLAGNREAELKPASFSSLLLFRVFLSLRFS